MSAVNKRDAMKLVADIRSAHVAGHAFASRSGEGYAYYFLGGLEAVLRHFLEQQGCTQAAAALKEAMNAEPTEAEIAARNEELARLLGKATGSAA